MLVDALVNLTGRAPFGREIDVPLARSTETTGNARTLIFPGAEIEKAEGIVPNDVLQKSITANRLTLVLTDPEVSDTITVTDDKGRYVIPDLPKANYNVWVRGYGLVDSPKVKSVPGKQLNLKAVLAPNEKSAAKYYPAQYWYSMMKIPEASVFGSKEAPENFKLTDYLNLMKNNGCVGCHQLGQLSTRTIPKFHLEGKTHKEAWIRRIQSGQAGENMVLQAAGQMGGLPFKYLADWTERVAKGELPAAWRAGGWPLGPEAGLLHFAV